MSTDRSNLGSSYKHKNLEQMQFFHEHGLENFGVFLKRRWIDHESQPTELVRIRKHYFDRFSIAEKYLNDLVKQKINFDETDQFKRVDTMSMLVRWKLKGYDLILEFNDHEEYNMLFLSLKLTPASLRYLYERK